MKREDLKSLIPDAEDGVIDEIMKLHGKDIETKKTDLATAQQSVADLQTQLGDANKTIEGFKKLDPEAIQKSADQWKAKAEQAAKDADASVAKLKFDHALEKELAGAKAKNPKAVKPFLDMEVLKLNEADGSIVGLKEQLEKIKSENDFLFEPEKPTPKILGGGANNSQKTTTGTLSEAIATKMFPKG